MGGGGNFAIVTEFEFALHDMDTEVLAGPIIHAAEHAREVLRFYRDFTANASDEQMVFAAMLIVLAAPRTAPNWLQGRSSQRTTTSMSSSMPQGGY